MRLVPEADETDSDASLMQQLAVGHMEALGVLVRRHQQAVHAVALRMTARSDMADDITQEAFLRVHRAAGTYRPTAEFRGWLYRIVSNLCLDRLRAPRVIGPPADRVMEASPPAEAPLLARELSQAVQAAVAALPERQRMALILHRYEGLSHSRIAQALETTEAAVESLLVRAYAELRQRLAKWKE